MASHYLFELMPAGGDASAIGCPCCGRSEWTFLREEIQLLPPEGDADSAITRDPSRTESSAITAATFLCNHCRFIRLQAV